MEYCIGVLDSWEVHGHLVCVKVLEMIQATLQALQIIIYGIC